MSGYICFIRSSLQDLHRVVYYTISFLLGPANKKGKTYYNLTSYINSLLRRRLFGSVTRNCLRDPPKEKKKTSALKAISNLSKLIRSE